MLGRIDLGEKKEPTPVGPKIYGIKRSLTTSDPAWERTDDAVNLYAEATHDGSEVRNDFDNIYPWSDIYTYSLDINTGKETKWSENGFNYTDDYIFTRIPEFWWKRWQDGSYEYIQIANYEAEGFTKSDVFSIGRYTISGSASGVYSKSGNEPLGTVTITNFRTYAQKLGNDFGILDWRYFIIQLLYLVEYANYNSRTILGQGVSNLPSTSDYIASGGCDILGMKSGCIKDDNKSSVIYRGIEDVFGNLFQFVDGININSAYVYICYDPTKYKVDTFTGDYKEFGYRLPTTSGYIKTIGYDKNNPLLALPIAVGGSNSTYIPDSYNATAGKYFAVGGLFSNSNQNGFWREAIIQSENGKNYTSRLLRYK